MTLTEQQREDLKLELDLLLAAEEPIAKAMEPLRKAIASIEEVRGMTLLRYGLIDMPPTCEGCECFILPGDKYHPTSDAGPLCEACAPTWGDCKAQLRERFSEGDSEAGEQLEAIAGHPDDAKCVREYQP